jgi:hypothetical protein
MSKTSPDHYSLPDGTRAYDITKHFDFTVGTIIKYLIRHGKKDGESSLDDLKKAKWYLNQLIERQENDAEAEREVDSTSSRVHLCPPSVFDITSTWID